MAITKADSASGAGHSNSPNNTSSCFVADNKTPPATAGFCCPWSNGLVEPEAEQAACFVVRQPDIHDGALQHMPFRPFT
jgi:hypothetical protein